MIVAKFVSSFAKAMPITSRSLTIHKGCEQRPSPSIWPSPKARTFRARGLSANRLALIGVPSGLITDILNGRRLTPADIAVLAAISATVRSSGSICILAARAQQRGADQAINLTRLGPTFHTRSQQ
jgi:hypothetical protein